MGSRFIFAATALGALMVSQTASALSCARPDLIRTLEEAKASPKIYHILVGRFAARGTSHPDREQDGYVSHEDQFKPQPPTITQSLFDGVSLSSSARYDHRLSQFPVDIETSCIGPWCSRVPDRNQDLIAFVEARPGRAPILRISACPSHSFPAERKSVVKVRRCLDQSCQQNDAGWPQ